MEVVILKPARGSLSTYQRIIMEAHLEAMTSQKTCPIFFCCLMVSWFMTVHDLSSVHVMVIAAEEVDPGKLEWHELTGEEDDSVSEQEETISVWKASNIIWYHF